MDDDRRQIVRWALISAAAMFGVPVLAPFIEPGGWAIWPALALIGVAMIGALKINAAWKRSDVDGE